jgi:hypothetical protein
MADSRALAILLTLSDLSPLCSVLVECWEMNEAEETFLDGYTTILMDTQVCETV